MVEAVVDLPDPSHPPPAADNADELLSQLAGEQIDRLLSEADSGTAMVAPAPIEAEPELPIAEPVATPLSEPAEPAAAVPAEAPPDSVEEAPSLLVRVLQILNSPFAATPPIVRDLLGKLAILFFINAVGFILFALLAKHR